MESKVVRILEREVVIRFFGGGLLIAPFFNVGFHLWYLQKTNHIPWGKIDYLAYFKSGNPVSYGLMLGSFVIGSRMLSGSTKAWKWVLYLIGAYLLIQIANLNSTAWQGPMAWPAFLLNAGLFFFIMDQLVWKVQPAPATVRNLHEKHYINLKSYRRILFNFGSDKPWGVLKTLSSEELCVMSFAPVPDSVETAAVNINFSKDVVIRIRFSRKEGGLYYFKPLNMQKDNVQKLNQWLKKIAV